MACILSDNIVSPLGQTTAENLAAVLDGRSALRRHDDPRRLLAPHTAAMFAERPQFDDLIERSAREAMSRAATDPQRTVFILSTTKGVTGTPPGETAASIARRLGIPNTPITVCNACVSGLSALILGQRLVDARLYDYAVVSGGDVQTEFIVSGFQSLKALSKDACRPFDMERCGLNLGEAAATVVLGRGETLGGAWHISRGSIHNDAYHTTQPSKRGDGLLRCLDDVMSGHTPDELSHINAHGTATLFNDQMEAVAIARAALDTVPVNGLKGYFGHTMGAAGLLETILSAHATDRGCIVGTRGFSELGVSAPLRISSGHQTTGKHAFLKTISGFGGCNAAVLLTKDADTPEPPTAPPDGWQTAHTVDLTPDSLTVDGEDRHTAAGSIQGLTALYKSLHDDYPHYYKMDALSRLGYVATQLLLQHEGTTSEAERDSRAVVLFNRTSSIVSDRRHLDSIARADEYFPSPSTFIYTLPNIVTGETAIRHGYHGETSFYILPQHDGRLEEAILHATLAPTAASSVITGWIDAADTTHFEARLRLLKQNKQNNKK